MFVLPAYLERTHDQQLRNRLRNAVRSEQTMFALVRGASCAGKTRTAFEAVRACLPDWQLVYPKTPEGLLALLDAGALAPRTVLWLNEAQNYLRGTEGEEAAAALHSRLEDTGPVVILGTLWPEYHRDLTATPQPGPGGEDAHPNARALLAWAVVVDVPASFTTESLKNPLVKRDPAIAAAAHTSTGGKITQTLAAGPQLVDHYEQATEPHGPYGHAVITAAMDARRLGHTSPLPAALLKAAAQAFLTEEQRAAADPDTWFDHALEYARQKVRAVAAALEPVANPDGMGPLPDVYRLSDYLDHHARTTRRYTFPPEPFWTAAQEHASTTDLPRLAAAAQERGRLRIAAGLSLRAAHAGDCSALVRLAWSREWDRDLVGAERLYQQAADAGHTQALVTLAERRERAGDTPGAERLYQQAADAGHHMALVTLAERRERAGDTPGAERLYQQAADAGHHM
ncbi:tetratricopeptide repeat protein, partial [Kitasatospora sp. NPDC058170]|uniref:tetratricopeptide repeat protein n=1 Tax=Kitasatospora sp. NPDC058170 TaxID=3346364 RepID=UPI0036DB5AF9